MKGWFVAICDPSSKKALKNQAHTWRDMKVNITSLHWNQFLIFFLNALLTNHYSSLPYQLPSSTPQSSKWFTMADTARATCTTWSSICHKLPHYILKSSSVWKFPQQRPARGQLLHPRASELDREGKGRQRVPAPQIGQRPSRDFWCSWVQHDADHSIKCWWCWYLCVPMKILPVSFRRYSARWSSRAIYTGSSNS